MELAKTMPFIAPVAFLICAVASSAATAVVLKNDCLQFVKVLNMVEDILVRSEHLESTSAIDDVRETLEEALGLMEAVQSKGFLTSTFLANAQKNRFEDLKEKLQVALGRLNLVATLQMSQLQSAKFDQVIAHTMYADIDCRCTNTILNRWISCNRAWRKWAVLRLSSMILPRCCSSKAPWRPLICSSSLQVYIYEHTHTHTQCTHTRTNTHAQTHTLTHSYEVIQGHSGK